MIKFKGKYYPVSTSNYIFKIKSMIFLSNRFQEDYPLGLYMAPRRFYSCTVQYGKKETNTDNGQFKYGLCY